LRLIYIVQGAHNKLGFYHIHDLMGYLIFVFKNAKISSHYFKVYSNLRKNSIVAIKTSQFSP